MTSKTKSRWGYLRQVTGLALGVVVVMGIVACDDGVTDVEEIDNAAIYARYFDMELPEDVRRVFENNQAASLERHLPAFEFCS